MRCSCMLSLQASFLRNSCAHTKSFSCTIRREEDAEWGVRSVFLLDSFFFPTLKYERFCNGQRGRAASVERMTFTRPAMRLAWSSLIQIDMKRSLVLLEEADVLDIGRRSTAIKSRFSKRLKNAQFIAGLNLAF
eukprot:IDg19051t1